MPWVGKSMDRKAARRRAEATAAAAVSMPDPLPCPFCGDDDVRIDEGDDVFRHAWCAMCGAHGPVAGTEDEDEQFGHDYARAAHRDCIIAWNSAPRAKSKRRR